MVDSLPPQNLTLNPSGTSCSFPLHRRRPLRSRTYGALIHILSHCRTTCSQLKLQEPANKEDASITCNESNSTDVLVSLPNSKSSNYMVVQDDSNDENKENTGFLDGGLENKQATNFNLHHIDSVTDEQQEVTPSDGISIEDFLVVDKEFSIDHFNEVFEACFGMDMDVQSSTGEDCQDKGAVLGNIRNDTEHGLKLKEMELEKLIHNSAGVESAFCLNADEEIEDGEISAEARAAGELFDALSNDAASVGERSTEKMHASEDCFDNEELFCEDEDRGCPQRETSDPSQVSIVNGDSNSMKMEGRTPAGPMQDCPTQNILHGKYVETQTSGAIVPCLENLTPSRKILQADAAENGNSFTAEKDPSKKKRKRGPLTKEKREKKRKKKGLKRAEKNRKLGVKRLKLQPVVKPKTIVYCRHYLQGRCHEGDKCNFSHDTVPLTKSKPCSHFARHSCMKGDECPYDHELSKYPCKNYASNGFCNRGSKCLFSHELPAKSCSITLGVSKPDLVSAQSTFSDKGGSNPTSKVTKPESKLLSPLNNSNSRKHMENHGVLHQKVDPKLCFASNSPGQSAEVLAAKPVPRTSGQPPKGVSFLLNRGTSPGDTNNDKRGGSSMKAPDGVGVGCKEFPKVPSSTSEVAAPRKRRGINFLSFGQPSADDSSSKIFSNLLSNSNNGAGKSAIDDMDKGGLLSVNGPMNPSGTRLPSNLNERVNGTPLTVPQHINIMSFNRSRLDDSLSKPTTNLHFSKADTALSFVGERPSTSKLHDTVKTPSLSFGGIWNQSTSGQTANPSTSLKKSILSNTPSLVQKAVQSTLAFAAKLEPDIKLGSSLHRRES